MKLVDRPGFEKCTTSTRSCGKSLGSSPLYIRSLASLAFYSGPTMIRFLRTFCAVGPLILFVSLERMRVNVVVKAQDDHDSSRRLSLNQSSPVKRVPLPLRQKVVVGSPAALLNIGLQIFYTCLHPTFAISLTASFACSYEGLSVRHLGGSRRRTVSPGQKRYTVGHQPIHC